MRLFLKAFVTSLSLLVLLSCSRLEKAKSMITAQEFKQTLQKDICSFEDVMVLFPKTVDEVHRYTTFAMDNAQKGFEVLLAHKKQDRTFENTARVLDSIRKDLSVVDSTISTLEMVHPQKEMRDACHEATLKIQKYIVDAFHQKVLYLAFKDYIESNLKKEHISAESQYYLNEAMRDFKRDGLDLPQKQLDKVKQLKKEIAEIELNFRTNIAQDKSSIVVEKEEELAGVSDTLLQVLKKDEKGRYILHCDNPTYVEIIEHCSCEQTRKKFYFAFTNRAYPQNEKLLIQLVEKRHQLAQVLRFKDFAALNIDGEMAKTPARVETFLLDLITKSTPKAETEATLWAQDLPQGIKLDDQGRFDPWSLPYIKTYYKKKHLDIDEHEIAEYFSAEKTIQGIFDVYQAFLGLKFTIFKPTWAWHEDVRVIQVNNAQDGKLVGYLFIDLYPRDDKYSHACQGGFVPTLKKITGQKTPSVAIIIANFPRSTKDKPALLKFDDVSTFFHEFGHAMHNLVGSTELATFSGCCVKTDFVEMPSQMFEEWLYDKTVLQKISNHYKTGQPLPDALIDRMFKLKQFDSGMFVLRQSVLALFALKLYSDLPQDPRILYQKLFEQYSPVIRYEPDTHHYASFGHIAQENYASKYYNYFWAKVFALDVFYRVKQKGLLNASAGRELIDKILGKGGSVDPDILLKNYLGREPNNEAFLKDLGIA